MNSFCEVAKLPGFIREGDLEKPIHAFSFDLRMKLKRNDISEGPGEFDGPHDREVASGDRNLKNSGPHVKSRAKQDDHRLLSRSNLQNLSLDHQTVRAGRRLNLVAEHHVVGSARVRRDVVEQGGDFEVDQSHLEVP